MAKSSAELSDELALNAELADEVAKEWSRYNKAVKDVSENYDDWMDILSSGSLKD
jgi:hypothetical protein